MSYSSPGDGRRSRRRRRRPIVRPTPNGLAPTTEVEQPKEVAPDSKESFYAERWGLASRNDLEYWGELTGWTLRVIHLPYFRLLD